ncbi:MAG TPA: M1 family aminopeptidase [Candidatus Angelobacter sp.]|nr:M1 family aminopeptidase [Candidatus Angelobacter sp.]
MNRKRKNCNNYDPSPKRAIYLITRVLALCVCVTGACRAQTSAPTGPLILYRQFLQPVFSAADVHHVRGVAIDREDLHIVLTDGVIGLMQAVDGHVTGAFFEGDGQILVIPPDRAERTSLALFTHSGVLDTQFQTAYLRFFDDKLVQALKSGFRPQDNPGQNAQYAEKWQKLAESLAPMDSLQLLQAMTNSADSTSQLLHLRLASATEGIFDVFFNTNLQEQISVSQSTTANRADFFNVWTSFPMRSAREGGKSGPIQSLAIHPSDFRIRSKISPPTDLEGEAELTLVARRAGQRTLMLQLSRYLKVSEARIEGQPVQFIQNEAISGSDLSRRGNDMVAVVLSAPLEKDHPVKLLLKYAGPVMYDAGGELIYVGSRGTWYPSPGPSFANFDLTFEYPSGWTLAATGRRVTSSTQNGVQTSRFVSDKPIPHAGFNLGRFETAAATSGSVVIDVYAAKTVEKAFAELEAKARIHPDPTKEVQNIADQASTSVQYLSRELGPFPYSHLEISQLPALLSQSWPGLIYLSSVAFLTGTERNAMGLRDPFAELLTSQLMLAHEIGHQWWGDAVEWESYRDEWMIEALANYCAAAMLERSDPAKMKIVLDHYRAELLKQTPNGIVADAGPVTLGQRLTSSRFPEAYEIVLYGRGTWLVHMLRTMLRQASGRDDDALFFTALKDLLSKSAGGKVSTRDLQHAFEQVLPPALFYEGQKSLDWFFDSWINGAAIPQFSLQDLRFVRTGAKLKVQGTIRQDFFAKDMVTAVPLYSVGEDGHSHFLAFVFADDPKTEFDLAVPAGTKDLLLDPENSVLRR